MKITESIHHGDYRNKRISHDIRSYPAFVAWLQKSPYATNAVTADNEYVDRLWDDLRFDGRGSFGWADYKVMDK